MAATSQTLNFDALVSTTLKNYTPRIEDNIFSNITLLYWLKEAGHIEKVTGGEQIVEPLLYGKNATTGSYAGYDNIPTTPTDGITAAIYDWKQFAVSIAISGLEEAKNSGEAAVISLLKAKIDQAEMSAMDAMNKMFYAAGTGNSGKDWNGLGNIVTTDGTGTVGGINAANETWWKNQFLATTATAKKLKSNKARPPGFRPAYRRSSATTWPGCCSAGCSRRPPSSTPTTIISA